MIFMIIFIASWLVFALFIRKDKLLYVYPSALLAMAMSLASDALLCFIPMWDYCDLDTNWPKEMYVFLDDFGLYPVIASLFVRFMPTSRIKWLFYTIAWTTGSIAFEWLMTYKGYMVYLDHWSFGCSYAADWVIFTILTVQYRIHLRLLNRQLLS